MDNESHLVGEKDGHLLVGAVGAQLLGAAPVVVDGQPETQRHVEGEADDEAEAQKVPVF